MNLGKESNQWAGKAFEQSIAALFNKQSLTNPYPNHLSNEDYYEIVNDAKEFLKQLAQSINIQSIKWIGNHTMLDSGDLIINDEISEIKHVHQGQGTWANISVKHIYDYLPKTFPSHIEFMEKVGLLEVIEKYTPTKKWLKDNRTANLLTRDQAHALDNAEDVSILDKNWRAAFVNDVFNELIKDEQNLQRFINDCVSKEICGKSTPKHLYVFNYKNKKLLSVSERDIKESINKHEYYVNDLSICLNQIRISFAWKNRCGCNLAMYIFLR